MHRHCPQLLETCFLILSSPTPAPSSIHIFNFQYAVIYLSFTYNAFIIQEYLINIKIKTSKEFLKLILGVVLFNLRRNYMLNLHLITVVIIYIYMNDNKWMI